MMANKNKILIVTGMHRSGTSVVAHWLNKCGLHMGDEMMGKGVGNEDGHFEDYDFLNAHEAILKAHRLDDKGYTNPVRNLTMEEKDRLNDIVIYKNNFNQQWGWKDPRTCLFLDAYHELIPDARYLVVYRDCQSVVSSLITRMYKHTVNKYSRRRGISKFIWEHIKKKKRLNRLFKKYSAKFVRLWITYNEEILGHIGRVATGNFIVTNYSVLQDNDKMIFEQLTQYWGFALNFFDFRDIFKDNLVHTTVDIGLYVKDKSLFSRAAEIENSLRQLSAISEKEQARLVV
jgi:hypothetical protein